MDRENERPPSRIPNTKGNSHKPSFLGDSARFLMRLSLRERAMAVRLSSFGGLFPVR